MSPWSDIDLPQSIALSLLFCDLDLAPTYSMLLDTITLGCHLYTQANTVGVKVIDRLSL